MHPTIDRLRQMLATGLTGLAAVACLACCLIPVLLAGGVLSGAGWAIAGHWLPGVAIALVAMAGLVWWWSIQHRSHTIGSVDGPE
jgi:hypothetical protein